MVECKNMKGELKYIFYLWWPTLGYVLKTYVGEWAILLSSLEYFERVQMSKKNSECSIEPRCPIIALEAICALGVEGCPSAKPSPLHSPEALRGCSAVAMEVGCYACQT